MGQATLRQHLDILLEASRGPGEPMDHLLLAGPPGLGKTSLAAVVAAEMGVACRITSGPALERAGDLASVLTNLEEGDVLFIDKIHRLPQVVRRRGPASSPLVAPRALVWPENMDARKPSATRSLRPTCPPRHS